VRQHANRIAMRQHKWSFRNLPFWSIPEAPGRGPADICALGMLKTHYLRNTTKAAPCRAQSEGRPYLSPVPVGDKARVPTAPCPSRRRRPATTHPPNREHQGVATKFRVNGPANPIESTLHAVKISRGRQLVSNSGDSHADIGGVNIQLAAGRQLRCHRRYLVIG